MILELIRDTLAIRERECWFNVTKVRQPAYNSLEYLFP